MTDDRSNWIERTGIRLRAVGHFLIERGGSATKAEVMKYLASVLEPTEEERQVVSGRQPRWEVHFSWQTSGLVKAGWLTKDGSGRWTITEAGRAALDEFPDPVDYWRELDRKYKEWEKERNETMTRRRAWLVRGSSVLGLDLVPSWLSEGFCSVPATQLRPIDTGVTRAELEEATREDFEHLKGAELKAKVDEITAFGVRMAVGDVVITTRDREVYVGDVSSGLSYVQSEGGRSNLRRDVIWRNADAPIDHDDLPGSLPARLKAGGTVVELTGDLPVIDSLGTPETSVEESAPATGPRHEQLREVSEGLAAALFVDAAWLAEVRQLLNERRQVIFYGPPGTGKTYIARKLAADLVGPDQVRLVQFHPAYTYEDFFEGYRPTPGTSAGTIGFELKPGPMRQLVRQAKEHPEQAFVLIIDEINRANLAKVFGELYFLLEYRNEAVSLLYSDDEGFALPDNLYIIGTMNTADRSIALIDTAMRRRFAFVELSPDLEPTRSLLRRWSAHHGLGEVAARLLDRLNQRIDDPDFRIGPSYFMTGKPGPDAHSRDRLERIWRTSILPLLHEHHYGEWESLKDRYRLETLLRDAGGDTGQAESPASSTELGSGAGPEGTGVS